MKLSDTDITHLIRAAILPKDTWYCFGSSFNNLFKLGLIDEFTYVTIEGKRFIKHYIKMRAH